MTDGPAPASRLLVSYARSHPAEAALAIAGGGAAAQTLLDGLPDAVLPDVAVHLPQGIATELLDRTADDTLVRWFSEASLDTAIRLARRIDPSRRAGFADRLPARRQRDLDRLCSYSDRSVGAYVDTSFSEVSDARSVADAVQELGSRGTRDRAPLLVVNEEGILIGWLDTQQALLCGPAGLVRDCVVPVRPVTANANLHTAMLEFAARNEPWLPVVDADARPIGLLHRSRLPHASPQPSAGGPALFVTLATVMSALLAESLALVMGEERSP